MLSIMAQDESSKDDDVIFSRINGAQYGPSVSSSTSFPSSNRLPSDWICSRVSLIFIIMCVMSCNISVVKAADPLCDFIAATNILSVSGYSQWSCTANGVTTTLPCASPVWNGVGCSSLSVVSLTFGSGLVIGKFAQCI